MKLRSTEILCIAALILSPFNAALDMFFEKE